MNICTIIYTRMDKRIQKTTPVKHSDMQLDWSAIIAGKLCFIIKIPGRGFDWNYIFFCFFYDA